MVKRYDPMSATGETFMAENEFGEWVLTTDYDRDIEQSRKDKATDISSCLEEVRNLRSKNSTLLAERDLLLAVKDVAQSKLKNKCGCTVPGMRFQVCEFHQMLDAWEQTNEAG